MEIIIKNAVDDLERSKTEYLNELINILKQISFKEKEFQDLKFSKIYTNEDIRRDNPSHELDINKKNIIITGAMGTGKTTCFDKLYHPFIARQKDKSPIKGFTTDITIEFENKEKKHIFTFKTNTKTGETIINLDGYNEETSLLILRNLGLIDNPILSIFFIPQYSGHDLLISDDKYFKKFSKFAELLYKPDELELKREFEHFLKDLKNTNNKMLNLIDQIKNRNIDVKADIENYNNEIDNIVKFIENFEELKTKLAEIKNNEILRDKIIIKNRINKEIIEIQHKLEKSKNIKDFNKKDIDNEIKELYIEYDPICPICNNFISLERFTKRKKNNLCFLCGSSRYKYLFKDLTPTYSQNEIISSKETLNFVERLKSLKMQTVLLNKEIKEIKDQTKGQNVELFEVMGKFYIDINRPGYSIDEEFSRQNNLRENYQRIISEKKKELDYNNSKLEKINIEIQKINSAIEKLEYHYHKFVDALKKENDKIFTEFVENMQDYWKIISNKKKKAVYYNKYEDNLIISSLSKNNNPKFNTVKSLTLHRQTKNSLSELNVVRYAIHLSLIKSLLKKYNNLPIRTIIIDDPDKECRKEFLRFLNNSFLSELNFQAIIFADELELDTENIEANYKNFEENPKNQNSTTHSFQITLDDFLKKRSEKKKMEYKGE